MKKLLSLALCFIMILSVLAVFTACGSSDSGYDYDDDENDEEQSENKDKDKDEEESGEKDEVAISDEKGKALPSKLVANKISSYNQSNILIYDGGYLYGKDNKIGISSFDGKSNSGAIYTSAKGTSKYFIVATQEVNIDPTKPASLNIFGLVDASGKEIVPCEYASIKILSERYVWVCNVTELTTSKDNAVTYMTKDGNVALYPKDDDYFFKGNWFIYDLMACKKVEGVTGTKAESPRIKNTIIYYKNDAGTEITVNENGVVISEDAFIMSDGSYLLGGKVYSSNGNELFKVKKGGFEPVRATDDDKYYVASKYVDHESYYALMDKTGKIVSAEFKGSIYVYGLVIENNKKFYNFKGEQIIEGEFDEIYYSTAAGIDIYFLKKGDETFVLDGAFNVIFKGKLEDGAKAYKSNGLIAKNANKVDTGYNYTTKDFSVDGYSTGFLMVLGGKYPTYNLNEVISGSTLIANSKNITVKNVDGTIYAVSNAGSEYEFYTIVAG